MALWQPWASLVAVGAKRIETRHWPAPAWVIGQRVAIHATKTRDHLFLATVDPFRSALAAGMAADRLKLVDGELPLGAIIATAVIDRCVRFDAASRDRLVRSGHEREAEFGDYAPGRYGFVLRDVETLGIPVAFTGRQGKFFDVPGHLLGHPDPAPAPPTQGCLM